MSKKAAVMLATGFEEGEALNIVDILRRAGLVCDMVSIEGEMVTGSHQITVKADKLISEEIAEYDMIILPGGLPGATNLRDDERVIHLIQTMNAAGKFVCAMCAAPIALAKAGVLENRNFTAYPGYDQKIETTGTFKEEIVVQDGNLITSRGPATVFAFAYYLADQLGGNSAPLREGMLYNLVLKNGQ